MLARVFAGGATLWAVSCGHASHAPFAATTDIPTHPRDAGSDANLIHVTPPTLPEQDARGICGRTVVPVALTPVNLYFILDASGSMGTPIDSPDVNGGVEISRYDAARAAIGDVLEAIGSRVSYGAAVFPGEPTGDPTTDVCPAGSEVLPLGPGDPATNTSSAQGPRLRTLLRVLGAHAPNGLTPTATTMAAVKDSLVGLEGKTYAVLLTDGAPNCDADLPCRASTCTVNIEGDCGQPKNVNCCDPALGLYDYRWCLDGDPTVAAVKDLADGGVQTYVIGMPGTESYAALLNRVAEAGGTAKSGKEEYYAVEDATALTEAVRKIGLSVAISCDVPLAEAPPSPDEVNVYFDQEIVPLDEKNGWTWTGDMSISLVGTYCEKLQTGVIKELQVVAGCPTYTR